ncbi:MAG: glutathione ABC transporter permease [Dehalococcoidia bacterium]|nr:MAG: glutathione ABC transporter permease [Dehalococcoidia bacterium]
MTRYLIRRAVSGVLVIAALLTLAFFATHYIGDPVFLLVNREITDPADREAVIAAGGFDRPVWEQYARFAGAAIRGDFGQSIWQNRPATIVVLERLPATFLLAGVVLLFTVVVSVTLALVAARTAGRWPAAVITTGSTALGSIASFWLALVLILIVAVQLGLLPSSGFGSWQHLILPVLALSAAPIGRVTQVLQTELNAQLRQPYVTVAIAKGLTRSQVMLRHVLRNSAIAALTVLGGELVVMLSVAVLVESIFAWPGVGQVALQAIQKRDLPVVMAAVVYTGVAVTLVNLFVDLGYAALDPRIRLA